MAHCALRTGLFVDATCPKFLLMDNAMPTDYRAKLQNLLRELFQFDSAELDFGIYRIMNQKRSEVDAFIQHDLLDAVSTAFGEFAQGVSQNAQAELKSLEKQVRETLGSAALDDAGNVTSAYKQLPLPLVASYEAKRAEAKVVAVSAEQEAQVFNDLYTFFARYYADGDFITLRRYGRDKYAIPYNGEEVMLHWANRDQYYVKTAETFRDYVFKVQPGGYTVYFKLTSAETEQNNVKSEARYFVPRAKSTVDYAGDTQTCTLFFEYRPLKDEEKDIYGKSRVQDALNAAAAPALLKAVPDVTLRERLGKEDETGLTALYRHLSKYTRRNTSDYFIHKDLRGFLQRELDFYIKNEIFRLDDLGSDLEPAEEPTRRLLARAKVVRHLGRQMIDFLAQIEDFQKRLFEKKKFVTQTDWCITLDHIVEEFYPAILTNKAQWAEWARLFKVKRPKGNGQAAAQFLRDHPSLVLDTQFFDDDFKDRLLASIENLDEQTDGVLVHGENFQTLRLLLQQYSGRVKCIYIDPPYNTGHDGFIYKDSFQHSSWLALMSDRLWLARDLLANDGVLFCSIDKNEAANLRHLLGACFGEENLVGDVVWKNATDNNPTQIALEHEYLFCFAKDIGALPPEWKSSYSYAKELLLERYESLKTRGLSLLEIEKQYREFIKDNSDVIGELERYKFIDGDGPYTGSESVHNPHPNGYDYEILHPVTKKPMRKPVNGYRFPWATMKRDFIDKDRLLYGIDENRIVKIKLYLQDYLDSFRSVISLDGRLGSYTVAAMFGERSELVFSNATPKPVQLLERLLSFASQDGEVFLDFFAGSGTTAHALVNLNRRDGRKRKYLLAEMGEYFDTVLKPRIQKVIYASDWKTGEPVEGATGSSHIFKYQRLESYEDTLNNLVFDPALKPQPELLPAFTDYTLRYMLDHETRASGPRLNVDKLAHPFDYTLNLVRQGETTETAVDLVETFNYLLGLTVTRQPTFEHQARPYRVVFGALGDETIAIIWRDLEGLDLEQDKDFILSTVFTGGMPDRVYVNGDSYVPNALSLDPIFKQRMAG